MARVVETNDAQNPSVSDLAGARLLLASWLRAARLARGLSLADVTRVTKIQRRALEHLEAGRFDSLPADVFVRGFVRSYARCVGLDPDEAVRRYSECAKVPGPTLTGAAKAAALIDSMAELAPETAAVHVITPEPEPAIVVEAEPPVVEPVIAAGSEPVEAPEPPAKKKRTRKPKAPGATPAPRKKRTRMAKGTLPPPPTVDETPAEDAAPVEAEVTFAPVQAVAETETAVEAAAATATATAAAAAAAAEAATASEAAATEAAAATESAPAPDPEPIAVEARDPLPTMAATTFTWVTSSAIRRRAVTPPRLVIDDDDPELAGREQDERALDDAEPARRSFLPPNLLENLLDQDRPRQGGLTLAVIILLIAATLTLSYLMRRPSSGGEGVTMRPGTSQRIA